MISVSSFRLILILVHWKYCPSSSCCALVGLNILGKDNNKTRGLVMLKWWKRFTGLHYRFRGLIRRLRNESPDMSLKNRYGAGDFSIRTSGTEFRKGCNVPFGFLIVYRFEPRSWIRALWVNSYVAYCVVINRLLIVK
ncbi:hypothetical protein Tco_1241221 [Tanacetum coccineum]